LIDGVEVPTIQENPPIVADFGALTTQLLEEARLMRRFVLLLVLAASTTFAQYDDYPVGEYEYPHHRVTISPIKVFGGMDATKRDEGPKVDLVWVPGIDIQELRYEYVGGPQGTFGYGPIVNAYLGLDSVKATSVAAGAFGRIYSGLGSGSYVQMSLQYFVQTGAYLFDGNPHQIFVAKPVKTALGQDSTVQESQILPKTEVKVQGPQFSPVLGIQKIFDRKWILEGQMGFTVGWYTVEYPGAPSTFDIHQGETTETYDATSDWGGFYFVQIGLGYAF